MILAIVGSRCARFDDCVGIIRHVIECNKPEAIISGGAYGVDTYAALIARRDYELPAIVCMPAAREWEHFKARDKLIAELCTALVWIKSSRTKTHGSGWTHDYAAEIGRRVDAFEVP